MSKKFSLGCLGLLMCAGIGVGAYLSTNSFATYAVDEVSTSIVEEEEAILPCKVSLSACEHGEVKASVLEGEVGDICILTLKSEMFYVIGEVKVNGVAILPIEGKTNEYQFALAKGENVVSVKFIIDTELLGKFSSIYEQVANKDWTNLFSFNNVMTIVSLVFKSGILAGLIVYVLKWKKIAQKVAITTKNEVDKALPIIAEKTNEITLNNVQPVFENLEGQMLEIKKALATFSKCFALMQQGDEDSKRAILDELSTLNLSDYATLEEIKSTINKFFEDAKKQYEDTLAQINSLAEDSKSTIEEIKGTIKEAEKELEKEELEIKGNDNGTQI